MTSTVETAETGIANWILRKEPVWSAFVAARLLALLGATLVGHKIIGSDHWTTLTNIVTPLAIVVIGEAFAQLTRRLVVPMSKVDVLIADLRDALAKVHLAPAVAAPAKPAAAGAPAADVTPAGS